MTFNLTQRRVEIHPALDEWMAGDRFGEIVGEVRRGRNRGAFKVRLDKSGRTVTLRDDDIYEFL